MLKNTKDSFEKFGYDVYCLNLVDPTNGIHYNPLDLVKQAYLKGDTTKAQMLANSLSFSLYHNPNAKEPMWEEASISLLNALILAICEIGIETKQTQIINMYAVTSMLEELGRTLMKKGIPLLIHFSMIYRQQVLRESNMAQSNSHKGLHVVVFYRNDGQAKELYV